MKAIKSLSRVLYDKFKQSLKKNGDILMAAATKTIQDTVTGKGINIPKYQLFVLSDGAEYIAVNKETGELVTYYIQTDISWGTVYKTYNGSYYWQWKSNEFYRIYESLGVL